MFITLITIVVFVLGIIGCMLYNRDIIPWKYKEYIELLSLCAVGIAGIAILIELPLIIGSQCTANKCIYEYSLERESIVKQVECISSEYEDVSKATVIANVYDWNKDVHNTKYWGNNPWMSWFYSQKFVDSLEYIELEIRI
nr:MAG TPA: hypothetical protein [Bacteriophage sp.]